MELIKRYKVLAAILAVVVAVGVGCWVYQLIFGLTVTGMNNGTSWGLYITNFMFFVGLSAGGLIVASSASVFLSLIHIFPLVEGNCFQERLEFGC